MRLSASGIHARLGGNDVLHGVDLAIEQGESVAIVGPNGSGKSTLVRTLSGVLRPASGTVRLDGSALRAMKPRERAASLGLLSQAADIPGFTTVREHIALGRFARRHAFAR
ncbi:MAG: ABC transporter ATP-binding protein, partial [Planctomycetota bacterium]